MHRCGAPKALRHCMEFVGANWTWHRRLNRICTYRDRLLFRNGGLKDGNY